MACDDEAYFKWRAEQERAKSAALPPGHPAAIAHRRLAEEYERGPQEDLHFAKDHPRA
jgi:hypothetical protein